MTLFSCKTRLDLPAHFAAMNGSAASFELLHLVKNTLQNPEISAGVMWANQHRWSHPDHHSKTLKHQFLAHERLLADYSLHGITPRFTFDMIERAHWLVHPWRMQDLDIQSLCAFHASVENNGDALNKRGLRHLPQHRIGMIMDILTRAPAEGRKGGRSADLDQMALMLHIRRTGASHTTVREIFKYTMPVSVLPDITRILYGFYEAPRLHNGWTWEDQTLHPEFVERLHRSFYRTEDYTATTPNPV